MKSIVKQKNESVNATDVESEKKSNASAKITQIAHEHYLGPIPHPKILTLLFQEGKQFKKLSPYQNTKIQHFLFTTPFFTMIIKQMNH